MTLCMGSLAGSVCWESTQADLHIRQEVSENLICHLRWRKVCLWDGEIVNQYDSHATWENCYSRRERKPLSKCALAAVGVTPGESPMQSRWPYQLLESYNRGGSMIIGQTFLGSWALNRRAFRKAWDMECGTERSGQGTPLGFLLSVFEALPQWLH